MSESSNDQQRSDEPCASPCIGVCVLDVSDVCEGCFRTMDEITRWSQCSPDQQREIVRLSWQRAKDAGRML